VIATTRAPRAFPARMARAVWKQEARSLVCPPEPRLDGKLALVTGGNGGIGLETCRGLLERGARVVMAARNQDKAAAARDALRAELGEHIPLELAPLDLGDLDSVAAFARELEVERIDLLIANAGVAPRRYAVSAQGHEQAFAVNVLGHFLLIQLLAPRLPAGARVVMLTGDIYCLVGACTPDYRFRSSLGGLLAYCRSKLGNQWLGAQLQARHPDWSVVTVHPGVVASGLGGQQEGDPSAPAISCVRGAQTSLIAATQPDLPPGAYLHNTMGLVELPAGDAALDDAKAAALWETCGALCAEWLAGGRG